MGKYLKWCPAPNRLDAPHVGQRFADGFWCVRCRHKLDGQSEVWEYVWTCPRCGETALYRPDATFEPGRNPCCLEEMRKLDWPVRGQETPGRKVRAMYDMQGFAPYSFVLVLDPTVDDFEKQGAQPQIVAEGTVLARTKEDAMMLAGRRLTAEHAEQTGRIRTFVRPF